MSVVVDFPDRSPQTLRNAYQAGYAQGKADAAPDELVNAARAFAQMCVDPKTWDQDLHDAATDIQWEARQLCDLLDADYPTPTVPDDPSRPFIEEEFRDRYEPEGNED